MNRPLHRSYWQTVLFCMVLLSITGKGYAKTARVLFIGNSYTYVNNLPQILKDVAASTGDTVIYDVSAPGGAAFYQHMDSTVCASLSKIKAGGWDYVVLQEQSQSPAYPDNLFDQWVYPYARQLADVARQYNTCAEVIFYMTWGRKNGDPTMCSTTTSGGWPWYCTYSAMDSMLRERYMLLTDSNHATVSPVGPVWHYIRDQYPGINLYDPDESHPSPAGSYAGACSFYTAIFKKPADSIRYNYTLSATVAADIRNAAGRVVYDSMGYWSIGRYETFAGFAYHKNGMQPVSFTNTSVNATQYDWSFGDGQTSTATSPTHTYTSPGVYTVRLVAKGASSCNDTTYTRIVMGTLGMENHAATLFTVAPNPVSGTLSIRSDLFTKAPYRIRVQNMLGQQVLEQTSTNEETQTIPVSGIAGGVYLLHISSAAGNSYSQKIIIR